MTVEIKLVDAPAFIAGLVREGVTFEAKQGDQHYPELMFITLLGGY